MKSMKPSTVRPARQLRSLALVALALGSAGCSSDGGVAAPGPDGGGTSRAYKGAVHVLYEGGTRKVALEMAEGYPRATIARRFELAVFGAADGGSGATDHSVVLAIDPLKETPSYEFPRDRDQLLVAVKRAGEPRQVGGISGFLKIESLDEDGAPGSAVISVALADSGGYGLVEIDLTLSRE